MLACSSYASHASPAGAGAAFDISELASSLSISPSQLELELLDALRRTLPAQTVAHVRYRPHHVSPAGPLGSLASNFADPRV